ncbi:MAG: sensor domain-containing protein [Acidimicrobiales bacterium]|nr:sensor domain-containing protein [Acidimicrobiales bacterium]
MTPTETNDGAVRFHLRIAGRERTINISEARLEQARTIARTIAREPFQRRTWSELAFFLISGLVACVGIAFIVATMAAGVFLAVVFLTGLLLIAASIRGARGIGSWHRALARHFLDERIAEPDPFLGRPGIWGWLRAALGDRAGWRAVAYCVVKMPVLVFGFWFGLSVWIEAFLCLLYPLSRGDGGVNGFGPFRNGIGPVPVGPGSSGLFHPELAFIYGAFLVFVAPWAMRLVVYLDRQVMRVLLGPDALTARVRSLEESRAQTVDASVATLRRIERDLHDGTQAQLVALAMQLGQAKEQLADEDGPDLDQVRLLIDQAHRGAKEAIVELRDLARGIHPPVLDTGLESALATLTARAAIPCELTASIGSRPTPAIEAIAYFCVAELLANVAQHAQASRASVSCVQLGNWLRIVVRDDGRGGAVLTRIGSSSSGLAGLTERVRAVDGHLSIASPPRGPTVVTVDLPCHA